MCKTYILYNPEIDKYYIGSTRDLELRLKEHNKSMHSSKYTRKQKGKWELVYSEEFETIGDAVKREKQIKSWKSKVMILKLIRAVPA